LADYCFDRGVFYPSIWSPQLLGSYSRWYSGTLAFEGRSVFCHLLTVRVFILQRCALAEQT
jgi:hypothetical protein